MDIAVIAAIAYGVLALAGGIMGYTKAGSKASLISGSVSGVLLLAAGLMQWGGIPIGYWIAVGVTAALIVVFVVRLVKTRKAMPAALMIGAGAIALVAMLLSLSPS